MAHHGIEIIPKLFGWVPKITKSSTVSGTQLPRQTLCAVGLNLSLCPSYLQCNWIITDPQTIAELLVLSRKERAPVVSWSHMQMATINRLKGLIPIKTLISYISSSFHFTLIISSVLTVDQRHLTHVREGKTKLSSKAPQLPSLPGCFVRSLKRRSSFFHPFGRWTMS